MNIQNDKKKPSIFRRVVTIVCCLSVMFMLALPSLAVGGYDTYPAEYPAPPEGVTEFAILKLPTSGTGDTYQSWVPVLVDFASNSRVTSVCIDDDDYKMVFCSWGPSTLAELDYYLLEGNSWVKYTDDTVTQYTASSYRITNPVYSTVWLGQMKDAAYQPYYYPMASGEYPSSNRYFAGSNAWFMQKYGNIYYQYRFSDPDSVVITITDDQKILSFEGTCSYNVVFPSVSKRDSWTTVSNSFDISSYNIVNSNFTLRTSTGEQYFPPVPPPPDPTESVTAGLGYVLNWVGQTVSQLFDGNLSGLLPLVAVPVAVTLLIVAIFFIKRTIWGG